MRQCVFWTLGHGVRKWRRNVSSRELTERATSTFSSLADQVDVPKNQVGLGDDGDIGPALLQLFEQVPCDPVLLLESVVRVGDGTDDDVLPSSRFVETGLSQCLTSRKSPQSSSWFVKVFMNPA